MGFQMKVFSSVTPLVAALALALWGGAVSAQNASQPPAGDPQAAPGAPQGGDLPAFPGVAPRDKPGQIAFAAGGEDGTGPYAPAGSAEPPADMQDIRGLWLIDEFRLFTTVDGKEPPLNAAGQNLWWHRRAKDNGGTPETSPGGKCQPPGQFLPGKFRVIQTQDRILITFEELHAVWSIYLNGTHPGGLKPSFMGHSIGHWEGDTLVVDVAGFNDASWLDFSGQPRSDALHMIVRISKMDQSRRLQFVYTIDDPKMYSGPFTVLRRARWRPDLQLLESNCEAAQVVDAELIRRSQ